LKTQCDALSTPCAPLRGAQEVHSEVPPFFGLEKGHFGDFGAFLKKLENFFYSDVQKAVSCNYGKNEKFSKKRKIF